MNNNESDFKKKVREYWNRFIGSISTQEKINLARHLAVGIKSGMSLLDSLELIKQQSSKKMKRVLDSVADDVRNGQSLAKSFSKFDQFFSDFFVSMIEVGERGGNLSQSLNFLSHELEKRKEVKRKVKSALIYPFIILIATIGVTVFLTLFIFPKITPIFESLGVDLPLTTQIVMGFLSFVNSYWIHLILGLVVLIGGGRAMLLHEKVHYYFDKLLISLPVISDVVIHVTLTNFTRSLNVLMKSGMPLVESLDIAKETFHNRFYREKIEEMIEVVRRGEEMTTYLEKKEKLFPPMLVGMIEVGEGVGSLEENLEYLSEYYESEVDEAIDTFTTILEPVLLLFMGVVVGFVALAIITPIYKVTQGLQV